MSTRSGLFYTWRFGNLVHYTFIFWFIFLFSSFRRFFCWKQYPKKQLLHGHLSLISETMHLRQRHAGHYLRSRDKLISLGRPSKTRTRQLWADTGCCLEDFQRANDDRDQWWDRIKGIFAISTTWWWWWWYQVFLSDKNFLSKVIYIYIRGWSRAFVGVILLLKKPNCI